MNQVNKMQIRHYTKEDDEAVTEIFRESNLSDDLMRHRDFESFVLEDGGEVIGIMTITEQHGYPILLHGCIKKAKRTFKTARLGANFFKYYCLNKGHTKGIVNDRKDDDSRIRRVIVERLFKCKEPYGETENSNWYMVIF